MTKFARKLRRKKLKEKKKEWDNRLRGIEDSLSNMPKNCSFCDAEFKNENTEEWIIKVGLEGAQLICPDCREDTSNEG